VAGLRPRRRRDKLWRAWSETGPTKRNDYLTNDYLTDDYPTNDY